jgi:hypothetical protein
MPNEPKHRRKRDSDSSEEDARIEKKQKNHRREKKQEQNVLLEDTLESFKKVLENIEAANVETNALLKKMKVVEVRVNKVHQTFEVKSEEVLRYMELQTKQGTEDMLKAVEVRVNESLKTLEERSEEVLGYIKLQTKQGTEDVLNTALKFISDVIGFPISAANMPGNTGAVRVNSLQEGC